MYNDSRSAMEQIWADLLQLIRLLPAGLNADMEREKRFNILAKELQIPSLLSDYPALRKRMKACGGFASLWEHCHSEVDLKVEQAWRQLVDDLAACELSDLGVAVPAGQLGAFLAPHLRLAQRFRDCPELRIRLCCEGGLCRILRNVLDYCISFARKNMLGSSPKRRLALAETTWPACSPQPCPDAAVRIYRSSTG